MLRVAKMSWVPSLWMYKVHIHQESLEIDDPNHALHHIFLDGRKIIPNGPGKCLEDGWAHLVNLNPTQFNDN